MGTGSCTISHFSQLSPFPVLMCGFFYFVIVVFLFCSSSNVPELNYQQSFYFLFWFGFVLTVLSRAGDLQRGILRRQF